MRRKYSWDVLGRERGGEEIIITGHASLLPDWAELRERRSQHYCCRSEKGMTLFIWSWRFGGVFPLATVDERLRGAAKAEDVKLLGT